MNANRNSYDDVNKALVCNKGVHGNGSGNVVQDGNWVEIGINATETGARCRKVSA